MRFELVDIGGWSYYTLPELKEKGLIHGFFTRSSPSLSPYQEEEREAFLQYFGLKDLIILRQVHGDEVHIIRQGVRPVAGDGMILMEKGIAGVIKTADCLPVIIAAPNHQVASIVHAGWRGTLKGIVVKAIEKMVGLGVEKEGMIAILGPSIGPCCYKVGQEILTRFIGEGLSGDGFIERGGALFFDIREANRLSLNAQGVKRVLDIGLCTFCNDHLFYSYRRGDKDRRHINFVSII